LQHESAFAAVCQGVTAEVEQGVVTLYGSVDTAWRKDQLADLMWTLPGVEQIANHLLAADELAAQLQQRFQALVTEGTLDRLPKALIEQQMVEFYGEVATPEQRNLLEREAMAVPGVRMVINHLSVPQECGPQVHTTNR
jgi:osmotically-inducible protein OsmY